MTPGLTTPAPTTPAPTTPAPTTLGHAGPGSGASGVWGAVVAAIDTGDPERVAACVLALDDPARREVAAALPAYIAVAERRAETRRQERVTRHERKSEAAWQEHLRKTTGRIVHDHERRRWDAPWNSPSPPSPDEDWIGPLRVAGAATIGSVMAVVNWLHRRDFQSRWNEAADTPAVLERVLATRPAAWQADFAVRAALRLRPNARRRRRRDDDAALALAMLRRTGATPPEHDPLLVAWVSRSPGTSADLRGDPLLDRLLPRMFDAEGVGRTLAGERPAPDTAPAGVRAVPGTWLAALTELERDGTIGRDLLLDGCLRRFLRGGPAADLRFFVHLHELLAPAPGEVAARARDYLRLLPAAPGPVAEPALRQLRRLGTLDPAELSHALRALLLRPERKLVTAGLTWFDEVARDSGGDLDELAPALGHAFTCESSDVQGRAVRMAVKHAKRFTGTGAQAIRASIGLLPAELGETLSAVFGGETAAGTAGERAGGTADQDGFTPVPLPRPEPAGPFPAPVRSVAELGEWPDRAGWVATESWLAAIVRLHGSDREGLAAKLFGGRPPGHPPERPWSLPWTWCREIVRLILTRAGSSATSPGAPPALVAASMATTSARAATSGAVSGAAPSARVSAPGVTAGGWKGGDAGEGRLPGPSGVSAPHLFLLRRFAEVHAAIEAGVALPPYLLAEPTGRTGHVDAEELVERLAGYERSGVEAMPADLQQALLRLPREIAPEVVARAAALTSEAGRAAARWMDGGRPDPVAEVGWMDGGAEEYRDDREPARLGGVWLVPRLHVAPTGLPLIDGLFAHPGHGRWEEGHGGFLPWWPYVMPSHREVVALHFLPLLLDQQAAPKMCPALAVPLALAAGPAGEGLAIVQAYAAADQSWSDSPEERARTVVGPAARGDLAAEEVGRQLALLVRRASVRPGPAFATLENAAAQGAHREVWRIMTGFLPVFLPGPGERPHSRHAQGLAFALRAARWAGARGALPCVAEVAARRASSTFVREARRLHSYLS
ncbi:DUF7824 domain-containing protein [Nonomuraea sp. NPDC002799]